MARRDYGSGSVEERAKGRWRVQVELGRDPGTGKRKRHRFTVLGTKREAQRALRQALSRRDSGVELNPERVTVTEYLEDWLRIGRTRLKPSTYDGYERDVRNHFEPALGGLPLRDLRPTHVQALVDQLSEAGLSARTVRRLYTQLHGALQTAVKLQLIALNPCQGASPPKAAQEEMRVLSVPEARRLLKTAESTPMYALLYVALETGARSGELLGLRWQDVDLDRGEIRINRTVRELSGRGIVEMEPKTHRSRRPVALSADSIRVLRLHRAEQNARRLALGSVWQDFDIVFASAVGTHWRPRNMARAFAGVVARAGLSDVTFHTLRHTSASLMAKQGVPVTSISAQLGHANASITQSIYSHVLPGMQHEAARQVAAALKL